MKKLENKVALITGGSSGIGLATAKLFVEQGGFVYITGRREAELDNAVKDIGHNVTAIQGDVAKLEDIDAIYATIKAANHRLDVVVSNAAFVEMRALADVTPQHFDQTFNVNARGTFFVVQKALPHLRDGASVVLVLSSAHVRAPAVYTTYAATKAAGRSFVATWAAALKERGIRVNSVSPGPIDTPIFEVQAGGNKEAADQMRTGFAKAVPLGRIGKPEEIANTILFLASSDSGFSTGTDVVVDGGISILM